MINPSTQDVCRFTMNIVHLLHSEGFYVNSLEETFFCLQDIIHKQVDTEINEAMGEYPCQSCPRTSAVITKASN